MHVSISGEMVKIDKVKNYKYVGRTVFEATYLGWVQSYIELKTNIYTTEIFQ
jgi:hypothetical protein